MSAAADAALAAVLLAVGLAAAPVLDRASAVDRPADAVAVALIAFAAAPLAVRRRWPVPVLLVTGACAAAYLLVGYPYGPILFSLAVAVYTVARHRPPRAAAAWSAAVGVALMAHVVTNAAALPGAVGLAPASAWIIVPFTVGYARRVATAAADRARADAQRRLLQDERLRMAHEVHDIVGHGLAAIQMQADIALHLRDRDPDQPVVALRAISRTSADALAELREVLGVLRAAPGSAEDARAPLPGLDRVDALRQRMEHAGVTVDLSVTGRPGPVPAAVDAAAYRVVQECLTNVVKHAADHHAVVAIDHGDGEITVRVRNRVRGPVRRRPGMGISGMARRVGALGGSFDAGSRGADTFEVVAVLPTAGDPRAGAADRPAGQAAGGAPTAGGPPDDAAVGERTPGDGSAPGSGPPG